MGGNFYEKNWANIKALEPQILAMRAVEKTRREIGKKLGLSKIQIKNWINRHNREANREESGLPPKRRGRKPSVTLQEYKYEIKRLKMENELLRDFLHAAGKK